jgi:hypothetical protein
VAPAGASTAQCLRRGRIAVAPGAARKRESGVPSFGAPTSFPTPLRNIASVSERQVFHPSF